MDFLGVVVALAALCAVIGSYTGYATASAIIVTVVLAYCVVRVALWKAEDRWEIGVRAYRDAALRRALSDTEKGASKTGIERARSQLSPFAGNLGESRHRREA